MSDARAIGVFDSGVGGLTVVHELINQLPNERIVYFGDTARVPYGTKSPKVVEQFALEDIYFLLKKDVKLIVAACHTVSSVALDQIIERLHLPILGVVDPGVKAALKVTRTNRIGVIGTRATVLSNTYEKKINKKMPAASVLTIACPLFVPLAEEGWLDTDITAQIAEHYLKPFTKDSIDTLILGCTHYPLLKVVIKKIVGQGIRVIDSAEETAKVVAYRLKVLGMENESGKKPDHEFYVSDIPHQFKKVGERFLQTKMDNLKQVDLESMKREDESL